jgi:hypothetical protein
MSILLFIHLIIFIITLLLYLGYIVTFTKVLTIYHSWIHPLHRSPLSPPPIPGIVSAGLIFHFHIWVHNIPTIFTSYTLSLYPPPLTGANLKTRTVLPSCSLFLKKDIFVCLRHPYRDFFFHCDISTYVCIVSWLVHPLHYSTLTRVSNRGKQEEREAKEIQKSRLENNSKYITFQMTLSFL